MLTFGTKFRGTPEFRPELPTKPARRVAKSSPDDDEFALVHDDDSHVIIPPFLGRERMQARASAKRKPNDENLTNPKKKTIRAGARCRQCGHEVRDGSDFYELHPERGIPGALYKQPVDVCRVPVDKRLPGFPVLTDQPLPRKSRAKKNLGK